MTARRYPRSILADLAIIVLLWLVLFAMAVISSLDVLGDDLPGCVNGHPMKRDPNTTYAHLPILACCARDHIIPLCLLGPDTLANLQYQPRVEAHKKDVLEWAACEAYCRGEITLEAAVAQFKREWGNNPLTAPNRIAPQSRL